MDNAVFNKLLLLLLSSWNQSHIAQISDFILLRLEKKVQTFKLQFVLKHIKYNILLNYFWVEFKLIFKWKEHTVNIWMKQKEVLGSSVRNTNAVCLAVTTLKGSVFQLWFLLNERLGCSASHLNIISLGYLSIVKDVKELHNILFLLHLPSLVWMMGKACWAGASSHILPAL